jgi:hypothetical protein
MYPIIKYFGMNTPYLKIKDSWGISREYSVITGIGTIIVIRYLRYFSNLKKYICETLFLLKCGNVIVIYFIDIRLSCWYLFACTIVWILFKQPMYNGPTNVIYISSEEMFKEKIKTKNKLIKGAENFWFTVFYSNYSDNCIYVRYNIIFIS